ncbi:hypothetical protein OHU10_24075 [Streptomyces europaeiscabiei]
MKTWKTSHDYAAKKAQVEHLYATADSEVIPEEGEPEVVFRMDEFGPLNLQPRAAVDRTRRPPQGPRPGTEAPPAGDLHPPAGGPAPVRRLRPGQGQALRGHIKPRKKRTRFLEFCRYLRSLYPPEIRIAIVLDNLSRAA